MSFCFDWSSFCALVNESTISVTPLLSLFEPALNCAVAFLIVFNEVTRVLVPSSNSLEPFNNFSAPFQFHPLMIVIYQ